MLFNSIAYFVFLPIVLCAYWVVPRKLRPALLLVASYVFYMSWIPAYGLLIAGLSAANYLLALGIDRWRLHARALLLAGLVVNLGSLCYFKYTNFLLDSLRPLINGAHAQLGFPPSVPDTALNIILPLGISFFAFEFIHYLVDVYKGDKPIRNPTDFGLFAAFFPSQIAGPIKRYQDFYKQLGDEIKFSFDNINEGMLLLMRGLFKKVALSDNLATFANSGFGNAAALGLVDAWVAALAFTFQIYFDFSGYTDMGRGSALMFGLRLPDNFNLPYIASSMSDFWKRWHISLSSWLRDYLYIPLGGGRCSALLKSRNLMITMLLGGLWHGAAWHFVVWGGYHGACLVLNHMYDSFAAKTAWLKALHEQVIGKLAAAATTFLLVIIGWVFFRADNMAAAMNVLAGMFGLQGASAASLVELSRSTLPVALSVYAAIWAAIAIARTTSWQAPFKLGYLERGVIYATIAIAAVGFSPSAPSPFIYFQF